MICAATELLGAAGNNPAGGLPFPPLRNDPDPKAQIARGEIPLEVYECLKIIDPRSEVAQRLEAQALRLLREHTPVDDYDVRAEPPRILFSDTSQPNAYYLPGSKPPVLIFSLALFTARVAVPSWYNDECRRAHGSGHTNYPIAPPDSRDVVVRNSTGFLVLAWHELGHHLKENNRSLAGFEVGKGEEGALYYIPIQLAARAGLRPEEAYYTWVKLLHHPGERLTWGSLLDVHPSEPLDEAVLEKAVATAVAKVRTTPATLETFDQSHPLSVAVSEARHRSFVQHALDEHGYSDAQDLPSQVRILSHVFSRICDPTAPPTAIRFKELFQVLQPLLQGKKSDAIPVAEVRDILELSVAYLRRTGDSPGMSQFYFLCARALGLNPPSRGIPGATELRGSLEAMRGKILSGAASSEIEGRVARTHALLEQVLKGTPPGFGLFLRALDGRIPQPLPSPAMEAPAVWAPYYELARKNPQFVEILVALGAAADVNLGEAWIRGHSYPDRAAGAAAFRAAIENSFFHGPYQESRDSRYVVDRSGRANFRVRSEAHIPATLEQALNSPLVEDSARIITQTTDLEFLRLLEKLATAAGEIVYEEHLLNYPARVIMVNEGTLVQDPELFLTFTARLIQKLQETREPGYGEALKFLIGGRAGVLSYEDKEKTDSGGSAADNQGALGVRLRSRTWGVTARACRELEAVDAKAVFGISLAKVLSKPHADAELQGAGWSHLLNQMQQLHAITGYELPHGFSRIVAALGQIPKQSDLPTERPLQFPKERGCALYEREALLIEGMNTIASLRPRDFRVNEMTSFLHSLADRHASGIPLRPHLSGRLRAPISACFRSGDIAEAAQLWKALYDVEALRPKSLETHLFTLVERLQNEARSPTEIRESAEVLLAGRAIIDVDAREALIRLWAKACAEEIGKDPGKPGTQEEARFLERLEERLKAIGNSGIILATPGASPATPAGAQPRIGRMDQLQMMQALSEEVVSQLAASSRLHARHTEVSADEIKNSRIYGVLGDGAFNAIRQSQDLRLATEEFLLSTGDSRACRVYAAALSEESVSVQRRVFEPSLSESDNHLSVLEPELQESLMRDFYENWWAMPARARVVIGSELLTPGKLATPADRMEVFHRVSERVSGGSSSTKTFLNIVIQAEDPNRESLLLSALMMGARQGARRNATLGSSLAVIADAHSVTARKISQRAASSPYVAKDIRDGLQVGKAEASRDPRPQVIELSHELQSDIVAAYRRWLEAEGLSVAADLHISHYGQQMGSASVYQYLSITMSDGRGMVLGFVKDDIAEEAEYGKGVVERGIPKLQGRDQTTALELNRLVAARIPIEIDTSRAPSQFAKLGQIYNDWEVLVNGKVHESYAARCFGAGTATRKNSRKQGFVLLEKVPGEHFIDSVPSTPEEHQAKREDAIAILSSEFSKILQLRFDSDRHGAQLKSRTENGRRIHGHFDAYGLADFESWTLEDRDQLARLLVRALELSTSNPDFGECFLQAQREAREAGEQINDLVLEVQNALLHFPEYSDFLQPGDMRRALFGALAGPVDAELRRCLAQHLDTRAGNLFSCWNPQDRTGDWKSLFIERIDLLMQGSTIPATFRPMLQSVLSAPGTREHLRTALDGLEGRLLSGEAASTALSAELIALRNRIGGLAKSIVRDEWLTFTPEQLFDFARQAAQMSLPEADRVIVRRKPGK